MRRTNRVCSVSAQLPRLFIGSSSEGRAVAEHLQVALDSTCDVHRWDQGIFEPGGTTLDSLLNEADRSDFAVLVASPDDITNSRGETTESARDNIVFEFGLFAGSLGRQRTYLLATSHDLKLPTDVLGLTRLAFRSNPGNPHAEVAHAALQVKKQVAHLGCRPRNNPQAAGPAGDSALVAEIELLCRNAAAQGWIVKTNSPTTLRLRSPRGRTFTLPKSRPATTRDDLRQFAAELRAAGLRVNSSLRRPVQDSPL